jgi:hypothetical protein
MLRRKFNLKFLTGMIFIASGLAACHTYDNFTTYFNTYYNSERLMKESENEFEYQDEKKRVMPRTFVVDGELAKSEEKKGVPPFMTRFIINAQQRQPVSVKLDSIVIKGSKILAKHP